MINAMALLIVTTLLFLRTLCRKKELMDKKDDPSVFPDQASWDNACKEPPEKYPLWIKYVTKDQHSEEWDSSNGFEIPDDGLLYIYFQCPSSNRSIRNEVNDKHCCIAIRYVLFLHFVTFVCLLF